jgi:hypothetical protein
MPLRTHHLDTRRTHLATRLATRLAAVGAATLVLTACGGDAEPEAADPGIEADDVEEEVVEPDGDDATEAGPADDDADELDGDPADGDDAGDAGDTSGPATPIDGELVVAGTDYEPEGALVCEDDGVFPFDVELELQVFAQGPDGDGQLDVFISELGADVSWSGEEGVFGDGLADSDIVFTGDRVSGRATVTDAFGSDESLDIGFDLAVPATTFQCR